VADFFSVVLILGAY